jgi:hypothetical protein
MKFFLFLLVQILFLDFAMTARQEIFKGEARENGTLVYIENHVVVFDDSNNVIEATTNYVDPTGKPLGYLKSDFKQSLSLPEHIFYDERTKGKYGIRRENDKIILFNQDAGKSEVTKELDNKIDKNRINVGCQGFNYYLKGKIESIRDIKSLPVLFMIPGELTTYKFVLNFLRENPDQTVDFNVKIENFFLRVFAPELAFRYDPKKQRIVWYKGVSNIKNPAGKTMNVEIDYKY